MTNNIICPYLGGIHDKASLRWYEQSDSYGQWDAWQQSSDSGQQGTQQRSDGYDQWGGQQQAGGYRHRKKGGSTVAWQHGRDPPHGQRWRDSHAVGGGEAGGPPPPSPGHSNRVNVVLSQNQGAPLEMFEGPAYDEMTTSCEHARGSYLGGELRCPHLSGTPVFCACSLGPTPPVPGQASTDGGAARRLHASLFTGQGWLPL